MAWPDVGPGRRLIEIQLNQRDEKERERERESARPLANEQTKKREQVGRECQLMEGPTRYRVRTT